MNITDQQKQILDACRAHLSWHDDRDDKALEVLVLKRHSDSGLTVQQLPVPEALWELFPPHEVITALAEASGVLGIAATTDTVAIALSYGAFALTPDASSQADEALRRHAAGGSIPPAEDIPGHIRRQFVSAVDRQGHHYLVSADRRGDGGDAPAVSLAFTEADQASGPVADALNSFAKAVWPHLAEGHGASAGHDDL